MIKYLHHSEINFQRWDTILEQSANTMPYAYSWYLNTLSPGWEALVADDYAAIMPLPYKRKYGVTYLIQPRFSQQLGIFSPQPLTQTLQHAFIKAIPYACYTLQCNYANTAIGGIAQPNLLLSLKAKYTDIAARYDHNTRRNLLQAQQAQLQIKRITSTECVNFWEQQPLNQQLGVPVAADLHKIATAAETHGIGNFYGVYLTNGDLVASLMTLQTAQRIIYLAPASSSRGKQVRAMFLLVDTLIRHYADHNILFDFEGSRIDGVARFYQGFGAYNEPYYCISRNRPQWLVNLLHRKQ